MPHIFLNTESQDNTVSAQVQAAERIHWLRIANMIYNPMGLYRLRAFHILTNVIPTAVQKVGTIINPILQRRKLKPREVKQLT